MHVVDMSLGFGIFERMLPLIGKTSGSLAARQLAVFRKNPPLQGLHGLCHRLLPLLQDRLTPCPLTLVNSCTDDSRLALNMQEPLCPSYYMSPPPQSRTQSRKPYEPPILPIITLPLPKRRRPKRRRSP
jgi:hypothetical protein